MPPKKPTATDDALSVQMNIRIAEADAARIDAVVDALRERTPGLEVGRSSGARIALLRGLDVLEVELGLAKPKRGR